MFTCYQGYAQELDFAVELTLKNQENKDYRATDDPEIKVLSSRHDITFSQSFQGTKNPELLPYYTLRGRGSMSKESRESAIKDFLATGKFEGDVREFEIVHTNSCTNPV